MVSGWCACCGCAGTRACTGQGSRDFTATALVPAGMFLDSCAQNPYLRSDDLFTQFVRENDDEAFEAFKKVRHHAYKPVASFHESQY